MITKTTNAKTLPKPTDSFSAFLDAPSRYLFFTGKGGMGKTSLACAAAVALAEQGKSALLVNAAPASNLDEMLANDQRELNRRLKLRENGKCLLGVQKTHY